MNTLMSLILIIMTAVALSPYAQGPAVGHRLAFNHDGNFHDPDDIGACAFVYAIAWAHGVTNKIVAMQHSGHIQSHTSRNMEADMIESAEGGATRFGVSQDKVWNCRQELNQLIAAFKEEAEKSTAGDRLIYCCAGPMEVPWRCLNSVQVAKRQYITVISHSSWNDNHTGGEMTHTWGSMQNLDGGAVFDHISDQNALLGSSARGKWEDLQTMEAKYGLPADTWDWLYQRQGGLSYSATGDVSDSGMLWYALTGSQNGSPADYINRFKNPLDPPPDTCMDEAAMNTGQKGACIYPCTDPEATNYNEAGPCTYPTGVFFTNLTDGQVFSSGATINLVDVTATFTSGSVSDITLYIDGNNIRNESVAPYQWNPSQDPILSNLSDGSHQFRAVATSSSGATAEKTITIHIGTAPPCCAIEGRPNYDPNCQNPDESVCELAGFRERVAAHPAISITNTHISINSAGRHAVQVRNARGEVIFSQSGTKSFDYSLREMKSGIYFIKASAGELEKTQKIFIP